MFHNDYLMRQIESLTVAFAEMVFNKPRYEIQSRINHAETDLLSMLLCRMVGDKNINGAEDLLFDMIDPDNHDHLLVAVDFYSRLNDMTDGELLDADFSRDEILRGLNEVRAIFSMSIKGDFSLSV